MPEEVTRKDIMIIPSAKCPVNKSGVFRDGDLVGTWFLVMTCRDFLPCDFSPLSWISPNADQVSEAP